MNKTLDHIARKWHMTFDKNTRMPIEIPNVGRKQLAELFGELDFKIGVEIGERAEEIMKNLCELNKYVNR